MAIRPYWRGYLKLSLVTCPVAMTPATSESEKVRFHTLNKETGNRVVSQYVDSVTGKPVQNEDEAKGYARGENDYVILTDDDLDAVQLDTVKTIDIEKFVEVNGEVVAQQREGRMRFTLQELFDRELSVYELDPSTLQPTGQMKSMVGAEVMQYFKMLFEVLYQESRGS